MNIMLTNDDGWDAPGILAAYRALAGLGKIYVVAPASERSACSHMITLRGPITVEHRTCDVAGQVFAVGGTPADCVRLAHAELMNGPIDLVVSGINRGANSGVDVFYSGTIAGAREGAILGIRSIALSQAIRRGVELDWTRAAEVCAAVIPDLLDETLPGPGFWSVNLPSPIPPDALDRIHRVPVAVEPVPMQFDRLTADSPEVATFGYGAPYWDRKVEGPTDYSTIRDGDVAISAIPLLGKF